MYYKVAVIRGGNEHSEQSMQYGQFLIKNLKRLGHKAVDVFVDKEGIWHIDGKPIMPANINHFADVVWNALYESPKNRSISIPALMQQVSVPLISETDFAFGILSQPSLFREFLKRNDIKTTPHVLYSHTADAIDEESRIYDFLRTVNKRISPIWSIEALGTHRYPQIIAKNQMDLFTAAHIFLDFEGEIVISNLPTGRRASVGIISNFRGQVQYPLIPLENKNEHGLHNTFSKEEKDKLIDLAKNIHALFDYPHHLSIDVVHSPHRGLVVERIHTRTIQYDQSHFCQGLNSLGIGHDEVLLHAIEQAITKNRR